MFGRHPRLPIDLAFGISKDRKQSVGSYVKNLRDRLTHADQLASEASRNAQVRHKEGYDIKVRGAVGFIREQEIPQEKPKPVPRP
jgi:hypothetical protein